MFQHRAYCKNGEIFEFFLLFVLSLLFLLCFSLGVRVGLLAFKEISVKTLTEHKIKKQTSEVIHD